MKSRRKSLEVVKLTMQLNDCKDAYVRLAHDFADLQRDFDNLKDNFDLLLRRGLMELVAREKLSPHIKDTSDMSDRIWSGHIW